MKNKIFRRVIAGVMSLGILLSMVPMAVTAAYDYTETIDKVTSLNVVPEKIEANAIVTRKELAKFMYYMLNITENGTVYKDDSFYDVDMTNEYHEYISAIAGYGLMVGVEEGVFAPDMNATFGMAVKVLIDATGYYPLAREGDLAAYARVASERGMLKNVTYVPNQAITAGELAQLIWNALQMRAVETTIAGNSTQIVTDVNLLWHYHKIALSEGKVTANENTGINTTEGVGVGRVMINHTTLYRVGEDNLSDFLGQNIDFYYKVDEDYDENIILWTRAKDSSTVVFTNKDDVTALGRTITYKSGSKQKTYKVSDVADMIYNGKYKPYNEGIADINSLVIGTVKLVEADKENQGYDLVIVESYIPYVVLGRDPENKTVYDRANHSTLEISKKANYTITKDGKLIDIVNLEQDDVLLVASDKYVVTGGVKNVDSVNSTVYKMVASSDVIVGTVKEIDADAKTAVIDDAMYNIEATFDGAGNTNVSLGKTSTFYIDAFGNVVYVVAGSTASNVRGIEGTIGFLTKVGDPARSIEEKITARIFDEKGMWATYDLAEKVRIDGEVYKTPQSMYSYLTDSQRVDGKIKDSQDAGYAVAFKLNDEGKINYIDTPTLGSRQDKKTSLDLVVDLAELQHFYGVLDKKYVLASSTPILSVPVDGGTGEVVTSLESNFQWISGSGFEKEVSYKFQIFNVPDNAAPELIIYPSQASGNVETNNAGTSWMVTKKIDTINGDGEPVTRLNIMGNGGNRTIDITSETTIQRIDLLDPMGNNVPWSIDDIKAGDVLMYGENTFGVTSVLVFFSLDYALTNDSINYVPEFSTQQGLRNAGSQHMAWGNLYSFDDGIIQILCANTYNPSDLSQKYVWPDNGSGIAIVCYDLDSNTAEVVTTDALRTVAKTKDTSKSDKILIRRYFGNLKEIFIYRNIVE